MKTCLSLIIVGLIAAMLGCVEPKSDPADLLSDSPSVLNGKWAITAVRCNGDLSTVWQNGTQSDHNLQVNIQDDVMTTSNTDSKGCQIQSSQTLKRLGNFNFQVVKNSESHSAQCVTPSTADDPTYNLNISAVSNSMTISDPSDTGICSDGNQSGPEVSYYSRITR